MSIGLSRRGFTLIEALVATVLAGVGVASVVAAFGSIEHAEARAIEKEVMTRLATEKYRELAAQGNLTNVGGTFQDKGEERFVWEAEVTTTGVEDVTELKVTVSFSDSTNREGSEAVYGAVYEEPAATTTTGATP